MHATWVTENLWHKSTRALDAHREKDTLKGLLPVYSFKPLNIAREILRQVPNECFPKVALPGDIKS